MRALARAHAGSYAHITASILYLTRPIQETERAIWSKVSSKLVLLEYSAIAIFAKIAIWRVFPDMVTFDTRPDNSWLDQ